MDAVTTISVPPLRDRQADLPELVNELVAAATRDHDRPPNPVRPDALDEYGWPGNVAELAEVIERAVAAASPGQPIGAEQLPARLRQVASRDSDAVRTPDLHATLADVEAAHIRRVLADCRGNQVRAAKRLGLHRNTLRRKLACLTGGSIHPR